MPWKLRLVLLYLKYFDKTDYDVVTPAEVRAINLKEANTIGKVIDYAPLPMEKVENRTIEMRDGVQIPIRIYHPTKGKNLPLIVYYHGGGFVCRDIDSHDKVCRRVAAENEAVVVSIGYRLAPEHKFPGPVEDCYDAFLWAAKHAKELDANPNQLILMGDSAGGNLATVTCINARDKNGPEIAGQVLIYPTTDARLCHPSVDGLGKGYFLTKKMMQWFTDHYKRTDEDVNNPLMSPFLTEDLRNLPPAFVFTAQYDPLKDEGEAYAKRLEEAGNQVIFKEYKGMIHGFMNIPRVTSDTFTAHEDIKDFVSDILRSVAV